MSGAQEARKQSAWESIHKAKFDKDAAALRKRKAEIDKMDKSSKEYADALVAYTRDEDALREWFMSVSP